VPIFEPVPESEASDDVRQAYHHVKKRYGGVVPELYQQLANNPGYLSSITEHMGDVMSPGAVDEAIAEVLAVASLWEEINRFAIGARLHWKS
jgi:hypothetical protein